MPPANPFDDDKLREECGVFGVTGVQDAANFVALGLHALQHRGQEAGGIVAHDPISHSPYPIPSDRHSWMYTYTWTYIYIYICMYTCLNIYHTYVIHMHPHTRTNGDVYVCIYIYIHMGVCQNCCYPNFVALSGMNRVWIGVWIRVWIGYESSVHRGTHHWWTFLLD